MIYLDNASTAKPCDAAVRAMTRAAEEFGNPSSMHGLGIRTEKMLGHARAVIAEMLGGREKSVYFTSGGTESDNTAVFGAARAMSREGRHIITTAIEHPAVLEPMKQLENEGFEVEYLKPDKDGSVRISDIEAAVRPDTVLLSMMHVNNETGAVQPVDKAGAVLKRTAPRALFHIDAVQSFGKLPIRAAKWGADMVSASAHKINGFQGTGVLYSDTVRMRPLMYGGGQQRGIRPGTENVPGICAFAAAAERAAAVKCDFAALRRYMKERILSEIENVHINGGDENSSGTVLNVSVYGLRAEVLLHALEARGVYVSAGSACSANKPQPSHVLGAMGVDRRGIECAVRMSFSHDTTISELSRAADIMCEEVKKLRR